MYGVRICASTNKTDKISIIVEIIKTFLHKELPSPLSSKLLSLEDTTVQTLPQYQDNCVDSLDR